MIAVVLKEAVQKIESELGGKVTTIYDCDDRWVLGLDWQEGTLTSIVFCVYKETGELGNFFPPDEPEVGKNAKRIFLPE